MIHKEWSKVVEEIKRRACTKCVDKEGIPVNINGKVGVVWLEKNPCEGCAVTKLGLLMGGDK